MMSIRVLLRDHPHRAIALVTHPHALIFRHSPSTTDAAANGSLPSVPVSGQTSGSTPRCIAELVDEQAVDNSDYRSLHPLPVQGTLGLITVNGDVFLCVVSSSTKVATITPQETVQRILAVEFCKLLTHLFTQVRLTDSRDSLPE